MKIIPFPKNIDAFTVLNQLGEIFDDWMLNENEKMIKQGRKVNVGKILRKHNIPLFSLDSTVFEFSDQHKIINKVHSLDKKQLILLHFDLKDARIFP